MRWSTLGGGPPAEEGAVGELLLDEEEEEEVSSGAEESEGEEGEERPDSPLDVLQLEPLPVEGWLAEVSDSEGEVDPDFGVRLGRYFVRSPSPEGGEE